MLDDKPDLSVSTFKAQLRVRSLGEPLTFFSYIRCVYAETLCKNYQQTSTQVQSERLTGVVALKIGTFNNCSKQKYIIVGERMVSSQGGEMKIDLNRVFTKVTFEPN